MNTAAYFAVYLEIEARLKLRPVTAVGGFSPSD
jgi:hypothetical protein